MSRQNQLSDNINKTKLKMFGGEAIAKMLQLHDVGPMMGMGGFQLLPMYEAFRKLGMKHYLSNDERAASAAMDAYARVTNKPGICDATLGPGATNLITSLVESLNAGIPMVCLVGDTNRDYSWLNMTQEAHQIEILRPACKEIIRIESAKRIPEIIRRAFAVATSGRPGPVVIDIPEDICHAEIEFDACEFWADSEVKYAPSKRCRPSATELERAAEMIVKSNRPILLVGGGIHISQAYKNLIAFAEDNAIPVCHTISGKGSIACNHPLSAGIFGRYSRIANDLIGESDLLIVAGCKLGEIATKRFQLIPSETPIIHLDICPEEFGRTTHADICLLGDAKLVLEDLNNAVKEHAKQSRKSREKYVSELPERILAWRQKSSAKLTSNDRPIDIARLYTELNIVMPEQSILVTDGGFAAHWGGLLYDTKCNGRTFIANRGFASIGYGLPGTIGAKLGAPDATVVGVTGDGGFNMMLGELETACRINLEFTIVVINNAASGYVKALQHLMFGSGNYQSSDLKEINYAKVASAIGCKGIRIEDPNNISSAFTEAFAHKGSPVVLDVVVTRNPAIMLPAIDNRTVKINKGDRIA